MNLLEMLGNANDVGKTQLFIKTKTDKYLHADKMSHAIKDLARTTFESPNTMKVISKLLARLFPLYVDTG